MTNKNRDLHRSGTAGTGHVGWLALVFLLSSLAGCGSGNGDSHLADSWTVTLGEPPASAACFRSGQRLPLLVEVRDRNGNVLPNDAITLGGDATSLLRQDGQGGWLIDGEGALDLLVAYTGSTGLASTIAPVRLLLRSDSTPPEIAVAAPIRSAMLVSDTDVQVQATVSEATAALASITVNGEEQLTDVGRQDWNIDTAPPGQWGMNTVNVVASDDCDNTARVTQS